MALPTQDWLHLAKRLPIGGSDRTHHGHEKRPNMTVWNHPDRYAVYCQACKQGGVVMKEHVIITGKKAPAESKSMILPPDMKRLLDHSEGVQDQVMRFLASKCMDPVYLTELWFSVSRCRIMVQHGTSWLGRDTTGESDQKWLTFDKTTHLDNGRKYARAIVVEDPFSFFKVSYALRDQPIAVYSSLGTTLNDKLLVKLLRHSSVHMFYDGDVAGWKGAMREGKRLRACGIPAIVDCAPPNMDPKDMTCADIRVRAVYTMGAGYPVLTQG